IADRLDAEFYWNRTDETVRDVDTAQKNVTELLKEVNAEYQQLIQELKLTRAQQQFTSVTLGDILEEYRVREKVESDSSYSLLGVRWWGAGVFVREEKSGREIKGSHLYRVSPDLIIYNRLFAFRGSFAIVAREHDGSYVSSEFPTFKMKPLVTSP